MSEKPRAMRDGSYVIGDEDLPSGCTLGGPDLCVRLKANGAIDGVVSIRSGATLLSALGIRHWDLETGVHLERNSGQFVLRPESQEHRYRLDEDLDVSETVFAFDDGSYEPPAACFVMTRIRNHSGRRLRIGSVVFSRIAETMSRADVDARYDEERRALIVWNRHGSPHARALVTSSKPASWAVTGDHARSVDNRWNGPFANTVDAVGSDPLGVLHLEHELRPGDEAAYEIVVVALPDGPDSLSQVLANLPQGDAAVRVTRARYDRALERAQVLTPVREVDLGVRWAKANMLRVMRTTPTGRGFTNDPGRSAACVGRDAAWFGHGCDSLDPEFSLELLRGFAARQEGDGKIVEWYDLRSGATHDDGLDVNDDTPLFILAVWHHVAMTGDRSALAELYPAAARAAEQLLSHRDERGLVWCSAEGVGAEGIVGWRNIIDDYRISGATTELNSEAFAALRRLGTLARGLGREEEARRWEDEAEALHAAIETHLKNPENGLYYLCLDVDGRPRSEISSDLVFPVIFGVCDDRTSARIIARLREKDMWTNAGVRTVPRDAPEYSPTKGHGLLGGVWVAVTFWYAFAAAKFVPEAMGSALATSFAHYGRDPGATNTVPGQFSEWLHGETLANQGMMLSPWFAPRYVWAAIEGACGLVPALDHIRIVPHVPAGWSWIAARNVPVHGSERSWVMVRTGEPRILATFGVKSDLEVETFARDVTAEVRVTGRDVAMVALEAENRVVVFLGNREPHTIAVAILCEGPLAGRRPRRRYEALRTTWCDDDLGDERQSVPVSLPRGGFALVEFV